MWPKTYERDVEAAWTRFRANPSHILQTQWGDVEFCTQGSGQPVLMGHGIFGSHVEAQAMTVTYYGEHALAIAPSRFGYFGSTLPPMRQPRFRLMYTRPYSITSASTARLPLVSPQAVRR